MKIMVNNPGCEAVLHRRHGACRTAVACDDVIYTQTTDVVESAGVLARSNDL